MRNKSQSHPLDAKLARITALLEQLIAVEMYRGGAPQKEIAANLEMSIGKVNSLIKGVKTLKENYGN